MTDHTKKDKTINADPEINRQKTKNCTTRTGSVSSSRSRLQEINLVTSRHTSEGIRMNNGHSKNGRGVIMGGGDYAFE